MQTLEKAAIDHEASLLAFDRQNHAGASAELASKLKAAVNEEAELLLADKRTAAGAINIKDNEQRMKEMNAFWLPSKTPEAKAVLDKPDTNTYCPASGNKLKLKDLIDLNFTPYVGDPHAYRPPFFELLTRQFASLTTSHLAGCPTLAPCHSWTPSLAMSSPMPPALSS
jgi:nitric oxide synthase-interacting protein